MTLEAINSRSQTTMIKTLKKLAKCFSIIKFDVEKDEYKNKSLGGGGDTVFKKGANFVKLFNLTNKTNTAVKEVLFTILFDRMFGLKYNAQSSPFPKVLGLNITGEDNDDTLTSLEMLMSPVDGTTITDLSCRLSDGISWANLISSVLGLLHAINMRFLSFGYVFVHADMHSSNLFVAQKDTALTLPDMSDNVTKKVTMHYKVSLIDFGHSSVIEMGAGESFELYNRLNKTLPDGIAARTSSLVLDSIAKCTKLSAKVLSHAVRNVVKKQRKSNPSQHLDYAFWLTLARIISEKTKMPLSENDMKLCATYVKTGGHLAATYNACRWIVGEQIQPSVIKNECTQ